MPAQTFAFLAFNRGLVSRLGLGRLDIDRIRISAQTMRNWIPRVLGSMMLRPGLQYIGATNSNLATRLIPFVFSNSDTAILEFTHTAMRVWKSDSLITRGSVSTLVANGSFTTDLSSWTDSDESGASSDWVTGGYMGLTGLGTTAAIRDQTVTVLTADQNKAHALRIIIQRGPVTIRVGTSAGDDSYISETTLATGVHSLAFTPTGSSFVIRFFSRLKRQVLVDSCTVESAGILSLTSPFTATELDLLQFDQSGDVIFIACDGFTQRRVERRNNDSWSIVQYLPEDGPFNILNTGPITLTPAALSGNTTLTASASLFKSTHAPSSTNAGALFRLDSNGQKVSATASAENTFTGSIRVTGVDAGRVFNITLTGLSATGSTVTLQKSLETATGPWTDANTYTTNQNVSFDDTLDNQIIWYRIGVKTGDYVAGTIGLNLTYTSGSISGVCRVTGYTSSTSVSVEVITDFGGTDAQQDWYEGQWSRAKGWPSSVSFHEGRLGWAGKDKINLSVSDAFSSFDDSVEGDSGPISRSIGQGPVDTFNWMVSSQRLLIGGQGAEFTAKSNAIDEPLTPTNFNLKTSSTQGSATVPAIKVDNKAIFVQKGGTRVFELAIDNDPSGIDYAAVDLTQLVPEVGEPTITRTAIQRQPDTRIHFVRQDGIAGILLFDKVEKVLCWFEVQSDGASGIIEDVCVLPGTSIEDHVYYVIRRVVNGNTVRYLEKWALESEAKGTTLNKQADSFATYSGVATTTPFVPTGTGSNLVTNGTFDTDISGWTDASTVSGSSVWDNGTLKLIGGGALGGNGAVYQAITVSAGVYYRMSVNVPSSSFLAGSVYIGTTIGGQEILATQAVGPTAGTYTFDIRASTSTIYLNLVGGNAVGGGYSLFDNVSVKEITGGLYHLEGEQVVVWADGADVGTATSTPSSWTYTYTVTNGTITLANSASNVCVGLPYKAQWKSGKLALAAALGVPLTKRKRIHGFGVILADTHALGLLFGRDFTNMDEMPRIRDGATVDTASVISDTDEGGLSFPGEWNTDSRLCLEARSPRPCTVVAAICDTELHEQR